MYSSPTVFRIYNSTIEHSYKTNIKEVFRSLRIKNDEKYAFCKCVSFSWFAEYATEGVFNWPIFKQIYQLAFSRSTQSEIVLDVLNVH